MRAPTSPTSERSGRTLCIWLADYQAYSGSGPGKLLVLIPDILAHLLVKLFKDAVDIVLG